MSPTANPKGSVRTALENPWRRFLPALWSLAAVGCFLGLVFTVAWAQAQMSSVAPLALCWMLGGLFGIVALSGEAYAQHADRQLAAFVQGDYLVHWTYSSEEWHGFLASPHAKLNFLAPRRWTQTPAEVYIGRAAVYFNGIYEAWTLIGLSLVHVKLLPENPSVLELCVSLGRGGIHLLRIPVPEGKEAEAKRVVDVLSRLASKE